MAFYNFQREAASTQMTMVKSFPQADRRSVSDPDIMIYPYKIHMVISKVVIKDVPPKPNVTRKRTARVVNLRLYGPAPKNLGR